MNAPQWKLLVVGVAMFAAAAASLAMKPSHKQANSRNIQVEQMVPTSFGAWKLDPSVVQVAPTPDVQISLNKIYDQIVSRTYVNTQGERMMLTIAYGGSQDDNLKAHRQEVCYSSQGFKISQLVEATLEIGKSTIPVTRMLAVLGNRSEPVTYWFTVGDQVVLSRFERLMVQLKYGLSGEIPDGMLVRVSSLGVDAQAAYRAHISFVKELVDSMKKEDAAHLLGGLGS